MAKISTVSLVEVSPSMVMALKVSSTAGSSEARSACGSMAASVKRKASMVAMSGAIMPAPLAMPLMVTETPVDLGLARGELGIGVGGHDGARRLGKAVGLRLARKRAEAPVILRASSGSPITPVEAI